MTTFTDLTPEGAKYFAELSQLSEYVVKVGFPEGSGEYEDGATIAEIAAYNEFGTSTIPARPFMTQSFDNHPDVIKAVCEEAKAVLDGGGEAMTALNMIGVACVGLMQEEIPNGGFTPNAASTIRQKGSETPLIDTGTMRGSVKYVVEKG